MSAPRKVLGVLGGMGPAATVAFLARVQALTPAEGDQDHIRIIADINPQVPDRNRQPDAAEKTLGQMAMRLRDAGAQVLAMPCNTAHAHADLIQRASGLPLVDMIATGARAARETGAIRVGVLGTKGGIRLYREYLAAQAMGLVMLTPVRQEAFMATLYRIKAGEVGRDVQREMQGYADDLAADGAEALIAGCTEVPLVLDPDAQKLDFIDPGELLARRCVAVCLGLEPLPSMPM